MAKIPKKLQRAPPPENKSSAKEDPKEGVRATIRSHDYRFREKGAVQGLKLDEKSQKQMARAKKLTSKGK